MCQIKLIIRQYNLQCQIQETHYNFFFEGVEDEIVSHARKLCLTNALSLILSFNQDYHDLNFHNISKSFIVSLEHSGKLRWVSYERHI